MEDEHAPVLDDFRLEVHPGDDLVARFSNAVLLMRAPAPRERARADQVVELCRGHDEQPGRDGRGLMRRVAGLLAAVEREDAPTFVLLVPTGQLVAVLLHGDVHVVVRGSTEHRLSGMDSATWVDRILGWDFERIDAHIRDVAAPTASFALDLRGGVVPGTGWTLARRDAAGPTHPPARAGAVAGQPERRRAEAATPEMTAVAGSAAMAAGQTGTRREDVDSEPLRIPPPLVPVQSVTRTDEPPAPPAESSSPTFESVLLVGVDSAETERDALPVAAEEDAEWEPEPHVPNIEGILCANGHFNDPAALYCRIDGISLSQRTHSFVRRPRPPLGVLVFDDGSSYSVDGDYVLGREPERDDSVQAGRVRPLVVKDDEDTVSRVHAEIRIDGWTPRIVDRGSVNGTYVAPPGTAIWNPLQPHEPSPLAPGTRVQIGGRTFVYDSHLKI